MERQKEKDLCFIGQISGTTDILIAVLEIYKLISGGGECLP
jgi:hypothetical protein